MSEAINRRYERMCRIVEAFNAIKYNEDGSVPEGQGIHWGAPAYKDLQGMISDKRSDLHLMDSRNQALVLETSQLLRDLGSTAAREYFHRVVQFI